jgi:hypothetical protein
MRNRACYGSASCGGGEESKEGFFFEKKNQKTFIRLAAAERRRGRTLQWMKSFFASFCSQKEDPSFTASPRAGN